MTHLSPTETVDHSTTKSQTQITNRNLGILYLFPNKVKLEENPYTKMFYLVTNHMLATNWTGTLSSVQFRSILQIF